MNFSVTIRIFLTLGLGSILSIGCSPNYEKYDQKQEVIDPKISLIENWGERDIATKPSEEDIQKITFADLKFRFFDQKCLDCHSTPRIARKPVPLMEYQDIVNHIEDIKKTLVQGTMPKQPKKFGKEALNQLRIEPATDEQIRMLRAWISAGMPNNGEAPPLTSSFESIKANILNPKCNTCHAQAPLSGKGQRSGSGIPSDFPLFNEDYIWANGLLQETDEPVDEGPFYLSLITSNDRKRMPLPFPGQTREDLTDLEKETILNWLKTLLDKKTKNPNP